MVADLCHLALSRCRVVAVSRCRDVALSPSAGLAQIIEIIAILNEFKDMEKIYALWNAK